MQGYQAIFSVFLKYGFEGGLKRIKEAMGKGFPVWHVGMAVPMNRGSLF